MQKGKSGLCLRTIAVIAFALCGIRQPLLVLLVTGFAILAEKDAWLNRQTLQALLLVITSYIVELIFSGVFDGVSQVLSWRGLYDAGNTISIIDNIMRAVAYIVLIVFCVVGGSRVLNGEDAGLPLLAKLVDGDFSMMLAPKPKPRTSRVKTHWEYQNVQTPYGGYCSVCAAPLMENAKFCIRCGATVIASTEKPSGFSAPGMEPQPQTVSFDQSSLSSSAENSNPPTVQDVLTKAEDTLISDGTYCAVCSAPFVEGAGFCIKCGSKLN